MQPAGSKCSRNHGLKVTTANVKSVPYCNLLVPLVIIKCKILNVNSIFKGLVLHRTHINHENVVLG